MVIETEESIRRQDELNVSTSYRELNALGFTYEYIANLLDKRMEEIIEYTGESPQVVADKIGHSNGQGTKEWHEIEPDNEAGLIKFHSQTKRKIYSMTGVCDYLAVIREKVLQRILVRRKPASLLDFGGSHGHFTIAAAQMGLDVTYADIGEEVRKFAQWRVAKRGLKVIFAPIEFDRCVFTNRVYDYIVCLDVISHLPNLPLYLKDFYFCLADDGELIFGDDLFDFSVPWHLKENEIYRDPDKKKELFKDFVPIEHLWANCTIYRKKEGINV